MRMLGKLVHPMQPAVDDPWPRLPSTVAGCRSYLAGKLVTEASALAPALGFFNFIVMLAWLKVAPHVILKGLASSARRKSEAELAATPRHARESASGTLALGPFEPLGRRWTTCEHCFCVVVGLLAIYNIAMFALARARV